MWKFIVKRVMLAILIIVLGSMVSYAVVRSLPTSFVDALAQQRSQLPGGKSFDEWKAELDAVYGLDKSIIEGYLIWGGNALRGVWGDSWHYNVPVLQKYGEVIPHTLALNLITLFIQIIVCIPLGILAARKQYSKTDYAITVFSLACISLPTFFLATILKYIFSIKLGWFDLFGAVGRYYHQLDGWGKFLDLAKHYFMPVLTLAMLNIGGLTRFTRTNMLEVMNADYIRTARAKGLSEKRVIYKHAFRNTLIPLVTYLSYLIPSMFSGSLITETLFQIPGIGWSSFEAMRVGDIPFSMFYLVFLIVLTQVSLMIADVMYAVVDPRVRVD